MTVESPDKIMVVEDDPTLANIISEHLTKLGYLCDLEAEGPKAVERLTVEKYKVVILDLTLGDSSGLDILRGMRKADENLNVLLIAPIESRRERLAGLEGGADDFILKPVGLPELEARVEAAIVKYRTKPKTKLEHGPLQMDLTNRTVSRSGRSISLTPTEFRILEILMRNEGEVVTRRMLCEFLWNPEWEGVTNVIEVHINRLRSKINQKGEPQLIHTVRGSGYILRIPEDYASSTSSDGARSDEFSSATNL